MIVQFPLIAYGRMFTPDWAHVLNFHTISYETVTCFLLMELVEWFILLFCNLGINRGPRPLYDTKKITKPEINLRHILSLTASMSHFSFFTNP
jgi:hypothetical protein